MKSLLWRIPLIIVGLSGIGISIWGLWMKFTIPITAEDYGILLIGLCLGALVISIALLWTATWREF